MAKLIDFLKGFRWVTITCHPNADPDCLGSAYALQSALNEHSPASRVTIYVPDGISSSSNKFAAYIGIAPSTEIPPETDVFALVDMPSLDQVPAVKAIVEEKGTPFALVDHHTKEKATFRRAAFSLVKTRSSTCEVLYGAIGRDIKEKKALEALLGGIIYDSRRFLIYPQTAVATASRIMRRGVEIQTVMETLFNDPDPSERMAKLKGASRLRLKRVGDWIIAFSNIGSFEASVARALTDLGADLALVVSEDDGKVRLTGRSTEKFSKSTGLNLGGDVMQPLAVEFNGQGGGHPTAASANLTASPKEVLKAAEALIAKRLGIPTSAFKDILTKK
ncbi:MAG: DHH family phosphoesterase [Candidatus Methanomethylicia archaeon]|nr:DHH family phosphoesterase [Candidatus Methanomethylicia archaeon]